ncbi:MAG: AAA family ATPase [Candidatus Dormibacteria bacterium]
MNSDLTPESFRSTALAIEAELGKVMVGQQDLVRNTLVALLAGGHVLLEGVPGLGKTVLVRTIADVLELGFSRIQFTPDLMPADIVGTNIIQEGEGGRSFSYQPGPVFANLVLADEVNRATPKTQSALLEAMQERTVTVGTATRMLPSPFFVLATQNPIDLEGTYPLPEAQLDRFMFKVLVPFPAEAELAEIARRTTGALESRVSKVAGAADLLAMAALARRVPLADHVAAYAARLVTATHPQHSQLESVRRFVRFGASPRGVQALVLAGKVRAVLDGRFNVAYDDLRAVALPALRHRVLLNFEAAAEGVTSDALLAELLTALAPE